MSERFSSYREALLVAAKKITVNKVDMEKCKELLDIGLPQLYTRVVGFKDNIILNQKVDAVKKKDPEGLINNRFNDCPDEVAWIVSKGLCDEEGLPFVTEDEVLDIFGPYAPIFLAWEVLHTNNFTSTDKAETVGN